MSLINDMLRDIDRRSTERKPTLPDGTVAVPAPRRLRWPPSWVLIGTAAVILAALGGFVLRGLLDRSARSPLPAVPETAAPETAAPALALAAQTPDIAPPAATQAGSLHAEPTPATIADEPVTAPPAEPPASTADTQAVTAPPKELPAPPAAPTAAAPQRAQPPAKATQPNMDPAAQRPPAAKPPPAAQPATVAEQAAVAVSGNTAAAPRIGPAAAHSASGHYDRALRALDAQDPDQAERSLLSALALDPAHAPSVEALAALLMRQGRRTDLEAVLRKLVFSQTQAAAPTLMLARLLVEDGRSAEARPLLDALPVSTLSADQLAMLAALQQHSGQHAEAAANFRRALAAGHRRASAWAGLAVSLEALLQPAEARAAWQAALAAGTLDAPLAQYARTRLAALRSVGD
ncbi:hypothetical protein C3497_10115 [Zoogloeaceae bacteirum Par-f-2]|nr:hypothetical protein C3497_10115 [Zoogloeaceae bacteirum Par-f-2]